MSRTDFSRRELLRNALALVTTPLIPKIPTTKPEFNPGYLGAFDPTILKDLPYGAQTGLGRGMTKCLVHIDDWSFTFPFSLSPVNFLPNREVKMPVPLNQIMGEMSPERRREIELGVGRQIIDMQPDMKAEIRIADGTEHHYRIFWSDEDNEYVAVHSGFPGLSWLEPDRMDAFKGLYDLIQDFRKDVDPTILPAARLENGDS